MKKTYWFTSASGKYMGAAQNLVKSGELLGVEIHILGTHCKTGEEARHIKIEGVLSVPCGYDKIAFVDADTLMVNVDGVGDVNGMVLNVRPMPFHKNTVNCGTEEDRRRRLNNLLEAARIEGVSEMLENKEGTDPIKIGTRRIGGLEWNGGVMIGDAKFMVELVTEWDRWWKIVNECNEGIFRRDQISLKFAYYNIAVKKYGYEQIDKAWNCLVKCWGFLENAHILHAAGKPSGRIRAKFRAISQQLLDGEGYNPTSYVEP